MHPHFLEYFHIFFIFEKLEIRYLKTNFDKHIHRVGEAFVFLS
jgi:hypothetical protein